MRPFPTTRRTPLPAATLAWLAAVLLSAGGAAAQGPAGVLTGFEPVGYLLEVDGAPAPKAEILQSQRGGAFLILDPGLPSPVLLRLRTARVETVDLMKVYKKSDGTVDLLPEPTLEEQGGFRVSDDGAGVSFSVGGKRLELREKPPLLGDQSLAGMRGYSPTYVRTAEAYRPSEPIVARLRSQAEGVRVEVFFGSWCPACQEMVPRLMRVHEALEGSAIDISYYGLPRDFGGDSRATRAGIRGVPTGIVYLGDREIGRISGNGWKVPELAINNILLSARRSAGG